MTSVPTPFKNSTKSRIFFLLSIYIFVYWFIAQTFNVYHFALTGAIFEILWLPTLGLLLFLPILSLIFWIKEKFNLKSFYFYTILLSVITILLMVLTA